MIKLECGLIGSNVQGTHEMHPTYDQLRQKLAAARQEIERLKGRPVPLTEWEKMEQDLAASQAENKKLRATFVQLQVLINDGVRRDKLSAVITDALATPSDTSALREFGVRVALKSRDGTRTKSVEEIVDEVLGK